jgi:hypothetical protein
MEMNMSDENPVVEPVVEPIQEAVVEKAQSCASEPVEYPKNILINLILHQICCLHSDQVSSFTFTDGQNQIAFSAKEIVDCLIWLKDQVEKAPVPVVD